MAIKIKFDNQHNAIRPTFVLAHRNGRKIGSIKARDIHFIDNSNSSSELHFIDMYSDLVTFCNTMFNADIGMRLRISGWFGAANGIHGLKLVCR